VMGVLAILASSGALMSFWQSVIYSPPEEKRAFLTTNMPLLTNGFWFVFVFALFVAGIWEGFARGIYGPIVAVLLVAGIAVVDEVRVSRPFVRATAQSNDPNDPMLRGHPLVDFFKERQQAGEVFRAAMLGYGANNLLAVHGIEQLSGHHGNEIGRYRELVGGELLDNMILSQFRLMDVTNTTYLFSSMAVTAPELTQITPGLYQKRDALPRAYLVGGTRVVPDSIAVGTLLGGAFDYRTTAMLPEPLPAGVTVQEGAQGTVEWVERGANGYHLRVQSDRPALLMVLDNYYPMWRATVDGNPVEILRANYTFRAIPIAAGQHDVQFRYEPANLRIPAIISAVLLVILGLLGIGLPLMARVKARRLAPAA
jgi:hypothetical protein